jgi:TolB-like protein
LSYASEDSDAAQRIADALSLAGIEVWFDRTELRGGDVWDRRIREQIRDCRLFIPLISANTERRDEGYFRREWALAAERTRDMAHNRAFVVPVIIDGTAERSASVPEKFQELHWTRLPNGEVPPVFTEQIRRLLAPESFAVAAPAAMRSGNAPPFTHSRALPRRFKGAALCVVTVSVIAVGYFVAERLWIPKGFTLSSSRTGITAAVGPEETRTSDKSIAVLPFVDMSEKHDQEYFSDGLTEELIDKLANAEDLKVVARTSSFAFKGRSEDIREIARKLGVANVLEGSVRRSGQRIRVTVQLIRSSDGTHIYSTTYDRMITDLFKVQDDIATAVLDALKSALRKPNYAPAVEPTADVHDLLLEGNFYRSRMRPGDLQRAIDAYRHASELAPGSPEVWVRLGNAYRADAGIGTTLVPEARRKAMQAIQKALALDPGFGYAHRALGLLFMHLDYDWPRAILELKIASQLGLPPASATDNDLDFARIKANATGDYTAVLALDARQVDYDPLDAGAWENYAIDFLWTGQTERALPAIQEAARLGPQQMGVWSKYAWVLHFLHRESEALEVSRKESDPDARQYDEATFLWSAGQHEKADEALATYVARNARTDAEGIAEAYMIRGDSTKALDWLERSAKEHQTSMLGLKWYPLWRPIRDAPRFVALVHMLKLDAPVEQAGVKPTAR